MERHYKSPLQDSYQSVPPAYRQRAYCYECIHNLEYSPLFSNASQDCLRQDGPSRNLPIPHILNIWSLLGVPELVITAIFTLTDIQNLANILI